MSSFNNLFRNLNLSKKPQLGPIFRTGGSNKYQKEGVYLNHNSYFRVFIQQFIDDFLILRHANPQNTSNLIASCRFCMAIYTQVGILSESHPLRIPQKRPGGLI